MKILNQQNRSYCKTLSDGNGLYLTAYGKKEITPAQITKEIEWDVKCGLVVLLEEAE